MNGLSGRIGLQSGRNANIWILLAFVAFIVWPLAGGVGQDQPAGGISAASDLSPTAPALSSSMIESLRWRSIGPSVMVGRIVDFAVVEADPATFWAAPATGGLWKTVNAGVTFEAQFQQQGSISIGAVAVAPSDPNIVWVGTGEENPRNSASWGDGVYKSTDGGRTWANMGLRQSYQIGAVVIHPANPEIAYVGALGRLWGSNEERGLFKTSDGGKSWQKILYIDNRTGIIDIHMNPADPNTFLAAMYVRERDMQDSIPDYDPSVKWSITAGIHKTTDGGKTFRKLTKGLPTVRVGRIGLDYHKKNPSIVFACIETELTGMSREQIEAALKRGPSPERTGPGREDHGPQRPLAATYNGQRENVQDQQGPGGFQSGGIFKSTDGGESWTRVNSVLSRPMYFSKIRVDPGDPNFVYLLGLSLFGSTDGGRTFAGNMSRGTHSDQHAMWIDPADGRHLLLGNDGGVYQTWDRCRSWLYHSNIVGSQIYHLAVDTRTPYYIYAGFQDNGSWGGPSRKRDGRGNRNQDWYSIGGGDGFVTLVDANDPDIVYSEIQDGRMTRRNLRTGESATLRPPTQEGERLRFLWDTPMILSNHNSSIFYCMSQYVFRSLQRGDNLRRISPDLTRTPVGSGSALGESPRNPDVIWAGTDDGYLWVTRNNGANWVNVTQNVGLPRPSYVSRIEPSRYSDGRCYVAFDAHRSDLDAPFIFVTEDFGASWRSLNANLPGGSTRVIREDVENENLLFAGTEFSIYTSVNRGQEWTEMKNNLPTGAVHDILVHPTEGELIAGTHGRGIWIADISPLRQMTAEALSAGTYLFKPHRATMWGASRPEGGATYGHQDLITDPAPTGAQIYYSLPSEGQQVSLKILTLDRQLVAEISQPGNKAGLNRVEWNLRRVPPTPPGSQPQAAGVGRGGQRGAGAPAGAQAAAGGGRGGRGGGGTPVEPGKYIVSLTVNGRELTQPLEIRPDPGF
ncbi:MAG: hypothetical protein H6Q05_2191 [Acidobacteria bacterium]|nr:hypothetical protein [Acidobacteriota bacterium]